MRKYTHAAVAALLFPRYTLRTRACARDRWLAQFIGLFLDALKTSWPQQEIYGGL